MLSWKHSTNIFLNMTQPQVFNFPLPTSQLFTAASHLHRKPCALLLRYYCWHFFTGNKQQKQGKKGSEQVSNHDDATQSREQQRVRE